ncbi:MAG: thioredoxin domain-containing protein [Myxococcales bacterium]|nr:thioredoxin domain-containing protein [Myxococcales bacterium]
MIRPTRKLTAGLCSALLLVACEGRIEDAAPADATDVVAVVDERSITIDELDDWIRDDLYRREVDGRSPSQLHRLRREALQRMIDEELVEAEARRRNIDASELLALEIEALGAVTDEQIEGFYAERADRFGGTPLAELAPRIREYLEQRRAGEAVTLLRERADVTVRLEPPRVAVASDGPSMGPAAAAVTIVEFSDFQCPYCQRALSVLRELRERYPNDVRIVYRHFPLDAIHPYARTSAEASLCAHDQGKFWPYHDKLFGNPGALTGDDLRRYAAELELEIDRFEQCLAERPHRETVETDAAAGSLAGVTGTPAFFVNGIFVEGAQPASTFAELIDAELAR